MGPARADEGDEGRRRCHDDEYFCAILVSVAGFLSQLLGLLCSEKVSHCACTTPRKVLSSEVMSAPARLIDITLRSLECRNARFFDLLEKHNKNPKTVRKPDRATKSSRRGDKVARPPPSRLWRAAQVPGKRGRSPDTRRGRAQALDVDIARVPSDSNSTRAFSVSRPLLCGFRFVCMSKVSAARSIADDWYVAWQASERRNRPLDDAERVRR